MKHRKYIIEFMNNGMILQTKRVARWDLVPKVVQKLLPNPMFTAVQIRQAK